MIEEITKMTEYYITCTRITEEISRISDEIIK
jgi:hypothetical protein